jgi:hypothetical protein
LGAQLTRTQHAAHGYAHRPRSRPSRYDRILYRSEGYVVREVTTVGAEPIGRRSGKGAASKDIYPSDHLGVFAVLSLSISLSSGVTPSRPTGSGCDPVSSSSAFSDLEGKAN